MQFQIVVLWKKHNQYLLVETLEAPTRQAAAQFFQNQRFCFPEELFTTYVVDILPRDSIPLIVDEEVPLRPVSEKS